MTELAAATDGSPELNNQCVMGYSRRIRATANLAFACGSIAMGTSSVEKWVYFRVGEELMR